MGNKKRKKRSRSPKASHTVNTKLPRVNSKNMDSSVDATLSPVTLNAIMDTLSSLGGKMDNNFKKLRDEMEIFKQDLKAEVQVLRNTVSELEMATQMSSSKIESLEVSNKSLLLSLASQVKEIAMLRAELKKQKESEVYSRRENLIFRNIPERPSENCRELNKSNALSCCTQDGKTHSRQTSTDYCQICVQGRQGGCLSKEESIKRIYSFPRCIHNLRLPE